MKKSTRERPPARKLNRKELDTGVLAAGCGTQGCAIFLRPGTLVINPAPFQLASFLLGSAIRFY
jgi:hypothetical protein